MIKQRGYGGSSGESYGWGSRKDTSSNTPIGSRIIQKTSMNLVSQANTVVKRKPKKKETKKRVSTPTHTGPLNKSFSMR